MRGYHRAAPQISGGCPGRRGWLVLIDPILSLLVALAFGLLFAAASLHKLRSLALFGTVLRAYQVLPPALLASAAAAIPLAEAAVAAGLLWPRTRAAAACLGIALLFSYSIGLGVNLRRGRLELDCGCTGPAERRPIAPYMVWRNVAFAALLALALLPVGSRVLAWPDALTVLGGLISLVLLYGALDGVFAHRADAAHSARGPA
jgi:Methylamine utilisation protein MauE